MTNVIASRAKQSRVSSVQTRDCFVACAPRNDTEMTVGKLLKKYHIRAKKSLGQNFLADPNLQHKLITPLHLTPEDTVLEIGSGLGVMAVAMAAQCRQVIAIEKDSSLLQIAKTEWHDVPNIQWISADFLETDLPEGPMKVLGNIPYNISTPILFRLLEYKDRFSKAVLTLQKEVVQRIVARPGNKDYGILSIMAQAQSRCEKLFDLPARCFIPPPEVTSSALCLDFQADLPWHIEEIEQLRGIVQKVFQQRRKTIRNSLPQEYQFLLEPLGISPQARPETIGVEKWVSLANAAVTRQPLHRV